MVSFDVGVVLHDTTNKLDEIVASNSVSPYSALPMSIATVTP